MSPEQFEDVVSGALGLVALPAGDQGYNLPAEDGLEIEAHFSAGRDYLLLLCPLMDFPEDGAHGAHLGALLSNLSSARSGIPTMAFDTHRAAFVARKALYSPSLGAHQLKAALDEFVSHCRQIRDRMHEAARVPA